jgi:hypothetical protein
LDLQGGSWLEGQLNTGGLEKFYWLLAVFIGVDLILFLLAAYLYKYNYDWYSLETSQPEAGDRASSQIEANPGRGLDPHVTR